MKTRIVIALLAAIVLISCSDKQTFKEIKIKERDLKETNIIGYGVGKSVLDTIAKEKAESNALMNLASQVSGMQFVYLKSNGSTVFKTTTSAKLSNVHEELSYCLEEGDRKKYLIALSALVEKQDIALDNAVLLKTNFRTEDLFKSLPEKYKSAVKEIAEKKYPEKAKIEGKLYLSDINISDYEGKNDFNVEIKILVIINENNYSGIKKECYDSGELRFEHSYKNGELHGISKEYYKSGKLFAKWAYKKGKLTSKSRTFYESGELQSKLNYVNGVRDGITKQYYENGELEIEWNYANSKLSGVIKQYYENGELKVEWNYLNDKKSGISKKYYESGELRCEWDYSNGKLSGVTKSYFDSGELEGEWLYKKGVLEGISKIFNKDGSLIEKRIYENGKLVK